MRTVDYSDVLQGSLALAGIPLAGFDTADPTFALMRTFHDRRLRVAWESHTWPDVCRIEQRSFRPPWNVATAYVAGDEVLDIPTLRYFQALQPSTGQPSTVGGVTNDLYWAVCQPAYQGDDYAADDLYALADIVRNPTDNQFYQLCNINLVPAGSVSPYFYNPPATGNPTYLVTETDSPWTPGVYIGYTNCGNPPDRLDNYPNRQKAVTMVAGFSPWTLGLLSSLGNGGAITATVMPTGFSPPGTYAPMPAPAPPNALYWGLLTPFNRTIAYQQTDVNGNALTPLGEVFAAWDRDPRITTKRVKLPYTVTNEGFLFTQLQHTFAYVWLHYRLQRPTLGGTPFDATLVYTAGRQVYFADATTRIGNFYTCTATTTAGQSPATTPAKWAVVPLPYVFREYLVQGAYADWLTSDGQTDKAAAIEGMAQALLELEADKLQRQQQQVNRLQWQG